MNKKRVVQGKELAWSVNEYVPLLPGDLHPAPAPTDAQRLRVAAALATVVRDERMRGKEPSGPNAETIRAVLVMSPEAWARDIGSIARVVSVYDATDPLVRFEQIRSAYRRIH